MINKFYVFGNIGKMSEVPKSGGQSSARRVIKGLEKMGYEMVTISRRRCVLEGKLIHFLETQSFAVIDLFKILGHIILGNRKTSAFLMLTYGGNLAPYELIITVVVRMLGYKSVIYMKGGQFMDYYNNGSKFYKWLVKKNMDLQAQAWFEGVPSLDIVKNISDTHVVYYPNYVVDENIAQEVDKRPSDRLNLIYFGRVTPDKNVDVVIKTFNIINEKYGDVYLYVIGGSGFSKSYVTEVDELIASSPYKNHIIRMGLTPFSEIKEIMQTIHMFVFPSNARCEGHSNSLNEAMGQGLIPVVSDYHFNGKIVGDERLLVNDYNPQSYASKIAYIRENLDMDKLAIQMRDKVKDNYSFDIVNNRIYEELKKL
ncbi:MAG: glycosyltransferase family 4 protein [Bacteroidales bacterium]|nr:glycosyltransferase family 4 protein [Bacteroidales bacterium]